MNYGERRFHVQMWMHGNRIETIKQYNKLHILTNIELYCMVYSDQFYIHILVLCLSIKYTLIYYLILLQQWINAVLCQYRIVHIPKYKRLCSLSYRERRSHARGVNTHKGYLVHENSKSQIRGRSGHKNNSKRVVKNIEGRDVGTLRGKSFDQTKTSAKDLAITPSNGRDFRYHK